MQVIAIADDGTTTIELTDAEAHALRDTLAAAAKTGNDPAWTLSRLLAHAHGDEG
ncbi:MAG TPA: hypothetical protein VI172_01685 [Candidatus Dormibacteraeota bacterium]|jgi:hypothetical protein